MLAQENHSSRNRTLPLQDSVGSSFSASLVRSRFWCFTLIAARVYSRGGEVADAADSLSSSCSYPSCCSTLVCWRLSASPLRYRRT